MHMKKILTLFVTLFTLAIVSQAQEKLIVKLEDKTSKYYSIDHPEDFLSQRALDRRAKHGIAIDVRDLPVSPEYIDQIVAKGFVVTNEIKWLNTLIVEGAQKEAIETLPFVKSVVVAQQPNRKATEKPFFLNEEVGDHLMPQKSTQQVLDNVYDYGQGLNQIEMLNGHLVHNAGYDGEGMVIAVLDAGFNNANNLEVFDSLFMNDRILGTANFVNEEDIYNTSISAHGTNVLSTMGAYLPGEFVGTAPQASYYLIRTEDSADEYLLEEYYWVDGAEYAESVGADVINSSLGYTENFSDPANDHTYQDMDGNTTPITIGADIAASKGILVVNSAGNSGQGSWFYLGAPSDGDSVLSVGAVDASGNYVAFSSKGPSYDGRVKPNVAAKGSSATVASQYGGITYANGTSFSSPITAGMVASIWQAFPNLSNMELMSLIEQYGSQYNNPDSLMGYGIPDYGAMLNVIGIEQIEGDYLHDIKVSPNPFDDRIEIQSATDNKLVRLALYSTSGVKLKKESVSGITNYVFTDLKMLPSGVYILQIETTNGYSTQKVIKK